MLEPSYIHGLTILGGEPFEPENQRALLPFIKRVRKAYPNKNIWAFSGFTFEQLMNDELHPRCEVTDEMLSLIDMLVDGRFVLEKKNIRLKFRGSENQRILKLPETLNAKTPVFWEGQKAYKKRDCVKQSLFVFNYVLILHCPQAYPKCDIRFARRRCLQAYQSAFQDS